MRASPKERQKLVDTNVPFVRSIAARVRDQLPREVDFEDLMQYGMQGLLEAAERYDGRHGTTFTTFAYYRVRGAIFDGLRSMGWLPRTEWQRIRFEERAASYLQNLADREAGAQAHEPPTAVVNVEEEMRHIAEALGGVAAIFFTALDAERAEGESPGVEPTQPHQRLERRERMRAVEQALRTLPEKERRLLELYYYEDRKLEEAGQKLGLSKSWSSRLHARAIQLLKRALEDAGVAEEPASGHKPRARR